MNYVIHISDHLLTSSQIAIRQYDFWNEGNDNKVYLGLCTKYTMVYKRQEAIRAQEKPESS